MQNALCLKCEHYHHESVMLKYGEASHPTMKWQCDKAMFPIDCEDGNGNVVAAICKEYDQRGKASV